MAHPRIIRAVGPESPFAGNTGLGSDPARFHTRPPGPEAALLIGAPLTLLSALRGRMSSAKALRSVCPLANSLGYEAGRTARRTDSTGVISPGVASTNPSPTLAVDAYLAGWP